MGGNGGTPTLTSPWTYEAADYHGKVIRISVPFNTTTKVVSNATVFRDVGCVYTKVYIGIPSGNPMVFTIPDGTTTVTTAQMAAKGVTTWDDLNSAQVTAGP
jgi:hypothetical protein